jgi:hypothetical protein
MFDDGFEVESYRSGVWHVNSDLGTPEKDELKIV